LYSVGRQDRDRRRSRDLRLLPPLFPQLRPRLRDDQLKGSSSMSIARKIAHKAEAVKGHAKKAAGRVTDNHRLEAEGQGDQAKGDLKLAGAKVKDAVKH
jgi:uncharacterized protein YjbJ (UPF0337 family)